MATCPSFIGARVLRVTRLDTCGRPVYGQCSQVVTNGFVSVEISPEVEEGEDYTQRNAAGDLCVSERGQDSLQWFTVSIEFCRVDPALFSLMNPTWKVVENAQGEPTGFRIGTKFSDREGFALELWPKAAASGVLCPEDAPDEAEPNGYFLLPYVLGTAPESWTLEDGVATFTLNGRTKGGSQWGRGPYNITHDAAGNPTPLLTPIDSGAESSDPDHFHADIVTLAPPTSACGCQPLEAMTPGAQGGEITTDPEQPNHACFTVSGSAARRVTIDWGDGSDPVTSRVGREECHLYTETGTYTVTISDIDDDTKSSSYDVEITEIPALSDPVIEATPSSGTAPLSIQLTVNNNNNGNVTITWGDDAPDETVAGNGANGTDPIDHPHQYTDPGTYTITVTAVEDDRAQATTEVQVQSETLAAPTNPTTSDVATTEVTLNWDWDAGTGPEATGFEAQYRTAPEGGDPGTWTDTPEVTDPEARSTTITGLEADTRYEAHVRATNAATESDYTDPVAVTTNAAPPADPTNLVVGAGAVSGDLDLGWDWEAGGGTETTGFEVRYRTAPEGGDPGTWSDPVQVPAADRTHTFEGLEADTRYEAGVTALADGSRSTEVTATGNAAA